MSNTESLVGVRDRLFTGVISDVLDSLGYKNQVAEIDLVQVVPDARVVGRARTARAVRVTTPPDEPYKHLLTAIDATGAGRVLVIAAEPDTDSSLFGGLLATALRAAGGEGVIVDGYARDCEEIRHVGMPTMVKGFRPRDSFARDEVVEIAEPVMIGGVLIHEGDLIFGDEDGLVIVPAKLESEVIEKALAKLDAESEMRAALDGGMSVATAFETFGVL